MVSYFVALVNLPYIVLIVNLRHQQQHPPLPPAYQVTDRDDNRFTLSLSSGEHLFRCNSDELRTEWITNVRACRPRLVQTLKHPHPLFVLSSWLRATPPRSFT